MTDEMDMALTAGQAEDTEEATEEVVYLSDEEGNETAFLVLARMDLGGNRYMVLADEQDEDSVMIFALIPNEDGDEELAPVEDEDECQDVFYYFQAASEDYEFCEAE